MVQECDNTGTEVSAGSSLQESYDCLPEDLDVTNRVENYTIPNNNRRRIPGVLYLLIGTASIVVTFVFGEDSVLLNRGLLVGGMVIVLFGLYHLQASWCLTTNEREALMQATRSVGFPVGHASIQLSWRGLRSRPTWRILLYSNEPEQTFPEQRGLVSVDGVTGDTLQSIVEKNPEDWVSHARDSD